MKTFEPASADEIEQRLESAHQAFLKHSRTSFADRAAKLRETAAILQSEKHRFGMMMTQEMGKTITAAEAEAEKCAWACRYYADHGEQMLAEEQIATEASRSYVRYDPIGTVLAVMPWNFPFWQVFRFAVPALMAGNTGLLKHASNVPQCALAIEEIFRRAGFAEGVFQTLLIESSQVASIIADDRIVAVTLTGSESAGSSVASQAGKHIKKTVLELGGSDPFIVMPSADLNDAVSTAVRARVINNGQSCIAAKRFIVADSIYDTFEREFVKRMGELNVGDPMDRSTDVGPLATPQILADLEGQVKRAVAAGGKVLIGGNRIEGTALLYQPTALANVPRTADVYREEFFGPVAMLFRARDAADAIEVANDSPFGLGSSVWTRDSAEQKMFAANIRAGQVFINAMVASDPRVPFGGTKKSGYGRELGTLGIHEFVNIKTVWMK